MFDERDFIERFESAGVEEAARMAAHPSIEEERALRAYLGDGRFRSIHARALRDGTRRAAPRGNVVVIPGVMGSHLASVDRGGDSDRVWLSVFRLLRGGLDRLRLAADGLAEHDKNYDVDSTDVLMKYYGDALFVLSAEWNVVPFHFDWRKDINLAADELRVRLGKFFPARAPVHIVAHSMGGLVARTFVKNHPERWKTMWDEKGNGKAGGRLVMLGTPNHGSYNMPQAITGAASLVKWLARLDIANDRAELLEIFNSFVGTYQMLPSPLEDSEAKPLYESKTYGSLNIPRSRLDAARKFHEETREVVGAERMAYIAGYGLPTFDGINDLGNLGSLDAYDATERGDGTVPHKLGLLDGVKTYFVAEEHGNLAMNDEVLSAMGGLLRTGETDALSERVPVRRGEESEEEKREAKRRIMASVAAEETRIEAVASRNTRRGPEPRYITSDEREIEEAIVRGFLGGGGEERIEEEKPPLPFGPSRIEVGLVCSEIQSLPYAEMATEGGSAVDALAVGQYEGVRPQNAELALDYEIGRVFSGKDDGSELSESDLIITRYFERGIVRGSLGEPFFLPDPRDGTGRVIALAGMGRPGAFGVPELAVVARELCWSLGRMGKKHLATVLVGSGNGNIPTKDAVSAWMRGIKYAVTGSLEDEGRTLLRVTFVERDPAKVEAMHDAILEEKRHLEEASRMEVAYHAPDAEELARRKEEERRRKSEEADDRTDDDSDVAPTRITLGLKKGGKYTFAAITDSASVPEREVRIDPDLIMSANDELAAESEPVLQIERGRFMEKLLVPRELRPRLSGNAPVVMTLDSTTARIHWEMVALPDLAGRPEDDRDAPFDPHRFLGTARGFTRQLRTVFAPVPDPPPPPRRLMRVLVIADPAEDARLAGAEEEGIEVAELFESFNAEGRSENRVEAVALLGPYEATRTAVMRHLTLHTYDVVHFAGHCEYVEKDPASSGWIFSGGKRLSASELSRIDRVPSFVFSNACESGITPDRSGRRSAALAPSFAESFFERGVGNFVCTAWPVDDSAARQFARTLYASLLGLGDGVPSPMHEAMREARTSIAKSPSGAMTWGAYQHYGSPYSRFFDPEGMAHE